MRVLKTVFKIAKGDEIYSVTVYRDKGMVYFDAYDPQTSRVFLTRCVNRTPLPLSRLLLPLPTDYPSTHIYPPLRRGCFSPCD